jgi:hypothetical protein
MPTTPLYAHRLAEGISVLTQMDADWIDRRTLGEILGVSKWTAWRVLKRCGAVEGPGGSLICRRDDLIARLQTLEQVGFAPEIARHHRVEQYLEGMAGFVRSKHREVARDAAADTMTSSRFSTLPPGVDLQPGGLRIAFTGTADFLAKFGAVVYALNNDFERIQEFLDSAG